MFISQTIPKSYFFINSRCFSVFASHATSRCTGILLRKPKCLRESFEPAKSLTQRMSNNRTMTRLFCTSDNERRMPSNRGRSLPALMNFPEIVWPSIFKTIKNFIFVNLIIRPYFDKDFALQDFIDGSKQALNIISTTLASGTEIGNLKGLVTQDALYEIKEAVAKMSMAQRNQLAVDKDDVYFCFPYQIGIMFDESGTVQKRWVEITMVYHVLRGAKELAERQEPISMNFAQDPQHQEKFSVCNYRFIKEFTKEQHSDWVVNVVNHFKPIDKARKYSSI